MCVLQNIVEVLAQLEQVCATQYRALLVCFWQLFFILKVAQNWLVQKNVLNKFLNLVFR